MSGDLSTLFASLADKRIPGGCPTCNAEQTVAERAPGVWMLTVAHDDHCPAWRSKAGRQGRN